MLILPVASIIIETAVLGNYSAIGLLSGKWFSFWAVGIRLFTAGLRQSFFPQFTAKDIFEFKTDESFIIIRELGFANISIGVLGIYSVFNSSWVMPAAIAGCLFYGLAGINHLFMKKRNRIENIAMISDIFIMLVLIIYFIQIKIK